MAKNNRNSSVEQGLSRLLADSYTLYLKTQNYHWNVTGPYFNTLHLMFQTQYEDLALAVDELAERLRALGEKAPGSYSAFEKLAKVKEETGSPSAPAMLKNLVRDQDTITTTAENLLKAAQAAGDEATADIAIGRVQVHQKNRWMLQAHLE